jgi:hypothetical protein
MHRINVKKQKQGVLGSAAVHRRAAMDRKLAVDWQDLFDEIDRTRSFES